MLFRLLLVAARAAVVAVVALPAGRFQYALLLPLQ